MGGWRILGMADGVNNTDAATVGQSLLKSGNLSGLADVGVARDNLGVDILALNIPFDGAGAEIADNYKVRVYCPFAFTILEWTLGADQSGSIVIDIWSRLHASYPPTVTQTITASAKPTISAALTGQNSTLTGWTVAVPAGSWLIFNVDSCTTIQEALLCLKVSRD